MKRSISIPASSWSVPTLGTFQRRLFILGAGFSQPAGLPVGSELFERIRVVVRKRSVDYNFLEEAIAGYIKYMQDCHGLLIEPNRIDCEEFLGFFERANFLSLGGGMELVTPFTTAEEKLKDPAYGEEHLPFGRAACIAIPNIIRRAIAEVLYRDPNAPLPIVYKDFAERLQPGDYVVTYNYDSVLESALLACGKKFRFYQPTVLSGSIEDTKITILKRHGSIDWFDKEPYDRNETFYNIDADSRGAERSSDGTPPERTNELVFGEDSLVNAEPIARTDETDESGSRQLKDIHRAVDIGPLLNMGGHNRWVPLLINPSTEKLTNLQKLRPFWNVLFAMGIHNRSVSIIGYSLPEYDEYVRQDMFFVFHEYRRNIRRQESFPNRRDMPFSNSPGIKCIPIRIIDRCEGGDSAWTIRKNYQFLDWKHVELNTEGFSTESVAWLFGE